MSSIFSWTSFFHELQGHMWENIFLRKTQICRPWQNCNEMGYILLQLPSRRSPELAILFENSPGSTHRRRKVSEAASYQQKYHSCLDKETKRIKWFNFLNDILNQKFFSLFYSFWARIVLGDVVTFFKIWEETKYLKFPASSFFWKKETFGFSPATFHDNCRNVVFINFFLKGLNWLYSTSMTDCRRDILSSKKEFDLQKVQVIEILLIHWQKTNFNDILHYLEQTWSKWIVLYTKFEISLTSKRFKV